MDATILSMPKPAVIGNDLGVIPKPDSLQFDASVYKKRSVMTDEKKNIIGNAVGTGVSAIGTIISGIFGGGFGNAAVPAAGSGSYGVPVNVGVDTSTKKWITYAGIAAGAVLLVSVLIMAFKKK